MWINLDSHQLEALKRIVNHAAVASAEGYADAAVILERVDHYEEPTRCDERYIAAAEGLSIVREGECEIDEQAVVAHSEAGAYVMAWVWVSDDDHGDDGPFVPRIAF